MKQNVSNTAEVRTPKWTGNKGEYAIVVSRGEPRRTDRQMYDAVLDQATRYLMQFAPEVYTESALSLAMGLIGRDHIFRQGAQIVTMTREHLIRYVEVAVDPLQEAAE